MATKTDKANERKEAIKRLHKILRPGAKLYTTVKHVSRTGMYRVIQIQAVHKGEIVTLSGSVAEATGYRWDDRHYGIGVGGCGSDAGFDIVHALSYAMYPKGFRCTGENCPANCHSNGDHRTKGRMHDKETGAPGYAFNHVRQ